MQLMGTSIWGLGFRVWGLGFRVKVRIPIIIPIKGRSFMNPGIWVKNECGNLGRVP